jgi:hypothetical protein
MARNRTIYSNEVLLVSPSATGYQFLNGDKSAAGESLLRQLKRIQNINYGYSINRTDTFQFGSLARISTVVLESPVVNLDFSYYLSDGKNEQLLGFNTNNDSNFLSPQVQSDPDGRNFFIYSTQEGKDAIGSISQINAQSSTEKSIVSLGNCYVTNYSASASVGSIPMASATVEGFNVRTENGRGMTGRSPGINITDGVSSDSLGRTFEISPEYISTGEGVSELLPGDIDISLGSASLLSLLTDTEDNTAAHIQNFSIDIPMSRTTLQRIGNSFGFSKSIDLPITASVSVSAIMADRPGSVKSLFTELYENNKNDLTVTLKKPSSAGAKKGDNAIVFKVKNATLDGESYGMSIGDNRTVDFSFSATIGEASTASSASYVDVNASGVYESWQQLVTGRSTDMPQHDLDAVSRLKGDTCGYGTAVGGNDNFLVIGASGFSPGKGQRGAAYVYKNNKGMYTQIQVLSGANTTHGIHSGERGVGDIDLGGVINASYLVTGGTVDANFGAACAVSSGNMLAIGMPNHAGSGAVAIYEPNPAETAFHINSVISGDRENSRFGNSVAFDKNLSGDGKQFFVVGAPRGEMVVEGHETAVSGEQGSVIVGYVTQGSVNSAKLNNNDAPTYQQLVMTDSVVTGDGIIGTNSRVGSSVAMHHGVVVAGAPGASGHADELHSGHALVWVATEGDGTTNTDWVLYAALSGTTENAVHPGFGCDVDIFNNTIIVGAPSGTHGGAAEAGAVYMFTGLNDNSDNDWTVKPKKWEYARTLVADDADSDDYFGFSVAMPNENTVIVGAPGTNTTYNGVSSIGGGSAYIFTGQNDAVHGVSDWTQTQRVEWTGNSTFDDAGMPEQALAATQKEVFLGENNQLHTTTSDNDREKVIRYRL